MFGLSYIRLGLLALAAIALVAVIGGFWLNYSGLQDDLAEALDAKARAEATIKQKDQLIADRDFIIQVLEDQAVETNQRLAELEQAEDEATQRWLDALEGIAVPVKDDPLSERSIHESADRLRDRNVSVNRMLEWETRR